MGDFKGMRKYFKWMNIYVIHETYRAMSGVVAECLKVHQMCLFPASYGKKYVTLDEFEATQVQVTSNVGMANFVFYFVKTYSVTADQTLERPVA